VRKQLQSIGNSLGIVLDRSILDFLRIGRETELEIRTDDGHRIIIEPVPERFSERVEDGRRR